MCALLRRKSGVSRYAAAVSHKASCAQPGGGRGQLPLQRKRAGGRCVRSVWLVSRRRRSKAKSGPRRRRRQEERSLIAAAAAAALDDCYRRDTQTHTSGRLGVGWERARRPTLQWWWCWPTTHSSSTIEECAPGKVHSNSHNTHTHI